MRYFSWLVLALVIGCSDGGDIELNDQSGWNFLKLPSSDINWIINSSKNIFLSDGDSGQNFASSNSCESRNFLQIGNRTISLPMNNSFLEPNGRSQFYGIDRSSEYIIVFAIDQLANHVYQGSQFYNSNNLVALYRLRPVNHNTIEVVEFYSSRSSQFGTIEICVVSNDVVIKFNNLRFEDLNDFVSGEFQSSKPTQILPG